MWRILKIMTIASANGAKVFLSVGLPKKLPTRFGHSEM
jgi:hypothetical protein